MIRGHCPVNPDQQVWARSHAPCGGALQTVECNVAVDEDIFKVYYIGTYREV